MLNGDEIDNQDDLLKFMIIMYKSNNCWQKKIYGSFLKKCRENKKIFNVQYVTLKKVTDKKPLYDLWKDIFDKFNSPYSTIGQLIDLMDNKNILEKSFIDTINSDNIYIEVLDVPVYELINLEKNNENPNVSTQHGVKGESHDSVLFVAEDSKKNSPRVYMYDFFRVWSQAVFSLDDFEDFYFEYLLCCKKVIDCLNFELKKINSEQLKIHKEFLLEKSTEISLIFNKNNIFNILCKDEYKEFIAKQTCKNAQKCFNEGMVSNVLSAYRLFYVGCSRARKNLTVFVDQENIESFKEDFEKKVKKIGFQIVAPSDI